VVGSVYETHCAPESVMLHNDVLLKCSIPSFVSDFVSVEAWVDSEAETFYMGNTYGTHTCT
jgi:hypothetical protein